MSGITEAVEKFPSPVSGKTGGVSAPRERAEERAGGRSSSAVSKVAWIPQPELGQTEWLATGRRLGAIGRCSQWWIGDWIRYGTSRWGEKYAEAARITGYDVASLRNMAWVAAQFEMSLRSDKLTWSHHVLLAPLDSEEKRYWLERADAERLSVADLRLELRRSHGDRPATDAEENREAAADREDVVVCPNCGHELHASAG
jgi:hypothetical protein